MRRPGSTICGTLHSVSTLLTTVGLPHRPLDLGIGRLGARIGALAFERIEQRGLFAAHIAPGADMEVQLEAVFRAKDIPAQIAVSGMLRRLPAPAARPPACMPSAGKCNRHRPGSHTR